MCTCVHTYIYVNYIKIPISAVTLAICNKNTDYSVTRSEVRPH